MTLAPLLQSSLAIQLHAVAAVAAFLLGALVLFRRKGDRLHRIGGRVWVGLMLVVAVSSFFIHTLQVIGIWSPIHLLSLATLWYLWRGVGLARARQIADHRTVMQTTYLGALVLAGLFTFWPGRIMHAVFFGGPAPVFGVAAAVLLAAGVLVLVRRMIVDGGAPRPTARAR